MHVERRSLDLVLNLSAKITSSQNKHKHHVYIYTLATSQNLYQHRKWLNRSWIQITKRSLDLQHQQQGSTNPAASKRSLPGSSEELTTWPAKNGRWNLFGEMSFQLVLIETRLCALTHAWYYMIHDIFICFVFIRCGMKIQETFDMIDTKRVNDQLRPSFTKHEQHPPM